MDDELLEFRAEFCAEAAESLTSAEAALREAVAEPSEKESSIEAAFRELHSIKGVAAALGLDLIRDLAHRAESLLARLKEPEQDVNDEIAAPLLEAFALLGDMVSAVSDSEDLDVYAGPVANGIKALEVVLDGDSAGGAVDLVGQLRLVEEALDVAKRQRPTVKMVEEALEALARLREQIAPGSEASEGARPEEADAEEDVEADEHDEEPEDAVAKPEA